MTKPTQHEKIIDLCKDGEWHCQVSFWQISKSPHKRRGEIEEEGKWQFEDRPCSHGHARVRDYRMVSVIGEKLVDAHKKDLDRTIRHMKLLQASFGF